MFSFLMLPRTPISTRTDTLFPYTTLFRSVEIVAGVVGRSPDLFLTQLAVGPHERVVELPVLVLPLRRDRHPCGFFRCRSEDWPVAIDDPDQIGRAHV